MRLELTHKFVIGFVLVAALAFKLPPVTESVGIPGFGAFSLALLLGAVLGGLLSSQITRNLGLLTGLADRISKGDLSADVDVPAGRRFPDETVDLARSVAAMLESLRALVGHIQAAAEEVQVSSRELSLSSQGVKATGQELSAAMESVAASTTLQRGNVEDTAARIHRIAASIGANAAAAIEAARFAAEADDRARAGMDASRLTVEKMQSLFERVDQAGRRVVRFDQKIRDVHRITEMITSIADKTHLLSLNASIEAARAGDAGRGFSAVAEEIRKLAESAGGQAEQIEARIDELQQESQSISEIMTTTGDGVRSGREDLSQILRSLEQLQSGVAEVSDRSEAIRHQADEQVGEAKRMVDDIERIAGVSNENAGAAEDMQRALVVQTEGLEEMVRHASRLFDMSVELGSVANRFRTRP